MKWDNVNVLQYVEISELLEENITPTDLILEVADVLLDDVPDDMPMNEFDILKKKISFISEPFKRPQKDTIFINKKKHSLVRFQSLTYAKWIDLDVFLTENNFADAVVSCAAILYKATEEEIEKCPITEVYGAIKSYIKYRKDVLEKFRGFLLADDDDEEEEEIEETETPEEEATSSRAVWMKTVHQLAGGDVTKAQDIFKLPHLLVFNWVAIAKDSESRPQSSTA